MGNIRGRAIISDPRVWPSVDRGVVSGEPSLGTPHETPDSSRGNVWDISGVTDASWTDRDFSAYCPQGVKMLYLKWYVSWIGNAARDYAIAALRKNGSTETDDNRLYLLTNYHANLANGVGEGNWGYVLVECDEDGIIESYVWGATATKGAASLYLHFMDYVI